MATSSTGAALGRPDREYGAYGMVRDKEGGAAPAAHERAVRGLGPEALPIDKE